MIYALLIKSNWKFPILKKSIGFEFPFIRRKITKTFSLT